MAPVIQDGDRGMSNERAGDQKGTASDESLGKISTDSLVAAADSAKARTRPAVVSGSSSDGPQSAAGAADVKVGVNLPQISVAVPQPFPNQSPLAASAKYATVHYLNFDDILPDEFEDYGRNGREKIVLDSKRDDGLKQLTVKATAELKDVAGLPFPQPHFETPSLRWVFLAFSRR